MAKTKFEEFKEAYDSLAIAKKIAGGAYSSNAEERNLARNFALREASKTPELERIIADPIAREQIPEHIINQYISTSVQNYAEGVSSIINSSGKEIIRDAPNKGLAEIVLGIKPIKIEGDEEYERTARIHEKIYECSKALEIYSKDGSKQGHEVFYAIAAKYAKGEIGNKLKDKEAIERVSAVLLATIASSERAGLVYVSSIIENATKEFNKRLENDEKKSEYARKILTKLYEKGEKDKVVAYLGAIKEEKK